MKLNGDQRKRFKEVLIDAFPKENLRQMIFNRVDRRCLNAIASNTAYDQFVFNLIDWAESQGKLEELLVGASQENPGNLELQNFVDEMITPFLESDIEFPAIKKNFKNLLQTLKRISNFDSVRQVLPFNPDARQQEMADIENSDLGTSIKLFLALRLLVRDYPCDNSIPRLVLWVQKLCQMQDLEAEVRQGLNNWLRETNQDTSQSLIMTNFESGSAIDCTLEAHLMVTVRPKIDRRTFILNAVWGIADEQGKILEDNMFPVDLSADIAIGKERMDISFKQVPEKIAQLIQQTKKTVSLESKKRRCETYELTVEFFLPYEYLHEEVDRWEIKEGRQGIPIGRRYRVVVRSLDRIDDFELRNQLRKTWKNIKQLLKDLKPDEMKLHFEDLGTLEKCSWKQLAGRLENKIGLKIACAIPVEKKRREALFSAVVQDSSVPIALWTRSDQISGVDVAAEMDRLLSLEALCDLKRLLERVREVRKQAYFEDGDKLCLGHHMAILCDDPNRIPPLWDNSLR